jgi:hypothetical protein
MELDGLENIIEILNTKGIPKHDKKVEKKEENNQPNEELPSECLAHL